MELRPLIGSVSSIVARFLARKSVAGRRRLLAAILMGMAELSNLTAVQAQDAARIDRVKAAFVLNIARFVSWPADAQLYQSDRMQLCLYRYNPLQQAMTTIAGEEVGGRPIEIRQIQSLSAGESCNILLISSVELQTFLNEVPPDFNRPMLTIADLTEADPPVDSKAGVLISLIRNGVRIGFEVDLEKSRHSGLRMSSELLKLANIVRENN